MNCLSARLGLLAILLLLLALIPASAHLSLAQDGADYAIPGGWFFTQTGGGQGLGYSVRDAGSDGNGATIRFWTELQRFGGVPVLGYPIGQPYVGPEGFTYQPFQRGILQWRPELGAAVLSNTFEWLQKAGLDASLLDAKGVPRPIPDDGSGGDYAKAVVIRMNWLMDDAIRARFLANPNPQANSNWNRDRAIDLYGLPMSLPERHGPFISQRFQRISFQRWIDDVPGMPPAGSVVGVLAGDLVKEAGLIPSPAIQPIELGGVAPLPAPIAVPTSSASPGSPSAFSWRVTGSRGFPNCGTTYIKGYVRDASGFGMNGMAVKTWNDFGNEYISGTRNNNQQDGYWDRAIGGGVRPGKWYAALVDGNGQQASDTATVNFTASCELNQGNVQEAEVIIQQR